MRLRAATLGAFLTHGPLLALAADDFTKLAGSCQAGKTKDCQKLAERARTDKSPAVRAAAASQVSDQAVLAEIARRDAVAEVRVAAVARLTDQAVLVELTKSEQPLELRTAAVGRITDEGVLLALAKAEPKTTLGAAAAKQISNPVALLDIAENLPYETTAVQVARERLLSMLEGVTDQKLLLQVATAEVKAPFKFDKARDAAMKKLTDQAVLEEIALTNPRMSISAVFAIKDLRRLVTIAKATQDEIVGRSCIDRLAADQALMEEVSRSAKLPIVSGWAMQNVTNPSAAGWNEVLLRAVGEQHWQQWEGLSAHRIQPTAEAAAALKKLAAQKSGYGSNAAAAILAGTTLSDWPRLSFEPGLTLRHIHSRRLPPGAITLLLGYATSSYRSNQDFQLPATLQSGQCYYVRAGQIGSSWSPKIAPEPCPKN